MWDERFLQHNAHLVSRCRYVVQDVLGAGQEALRLGIVAPELVGAIVDLTAVPRTNCTEQVIASVGGLVAHGQTAIAQRYFGFVAAILYRVSPVHELTILTSERVARLPAIQAEPLVKAVCVSHRQAIAKFRDADLVFSSPGLTTLLELAALGTPTLPLPPQNYSQTHIPERLALEDSDAHPAWTVLAKYFAPPKGLAELDGNRWTTGRLREFAADEGVLREYVGVMTKYDTAHCPRLRVRSFTGAADVARLVCEMEGLALTGDAACYGIVLRA